MKDNIYNKELFADDAKLGGKDVTEEKMIELIQTLKSGTQEEKGTIILDILDHYKITDEVKELLRTEMELVKSIRNTYCYPGAEI